MAGQPAAGDDSGPATLVAHKNDHSDDSRRRVGPNRWLGVVLTVQNRARFGFRALPRCPVRGGHRARRMATEELFGL